MFKLAIFAGTTEGRRLAEECEKCGTTVLVFTATEYGGELLPDGVTVHTGRLDTAQMAAALSGVSLAVDATHPYAEEATRNIRTACRQTGTEYVRLLRETCEVIGESVPDMDGLIAKLNACGDTVLSVLGSKSLERLSAVNGAFDRIWLRLLPVDGIADKCAALGFDRNKLILEKPPFSAEQNIAHIRQSNAKILVTKESGKVGGYPEKVSAAKECNIRMITLTHPAEEGLGYEQVLRLIFERGANI